MKAVNLIPSDQRGGGGGGGGAGASLAGSSEGGAFIVLGLMAGLAVLALLYGVAHHQIASRGNEASTLSAEAAATQAQATQLAPYTSFAAMHKERQQAISQLVETRFDWAHALHELGRVLPFDVSLTSVHGSTGTGSGSSTPATPAASGGAASSSVASATPPGTAPVFTLVGCATSQSEVAKTMGRLRLMDGVANVELQSSTKPESSTSGSSGSSGCPSANDPSFTVQVTFQPLPTPSAGASAAAPATSTAAASSAATSATASSPASGSATGSSTSATAPKGGS